MIRFLPALLVLAVASPALAHRQPEVVTTVEAVEEGGESLLHVTHRLHAHDAIAALRARGVDQPRLEEPEHQARLALYLLDRFELSGDAKSEVLGAEVEGNYVFVYLTHPEAAAVLGSAILGDVASGWTNRVDVKAGGATLRSVTFSADHPHADEPVLPSGGPRANARP
jgi:hypothetical protein